MQFKVPQFLEIEDKIFGPFTFREFVYLAGGGGLCFIIYKLLGLQWGILPILAVGGIAASLTFYKPNNKPFINMIEAGLRFYSQDKLYIWKRREERVDLQKARQGKENLANQPMAQNTTRLSGSKLRDLAWSLDVLDLKKQ
jgi:PrgI family protein